MRTSALLYGEREHYLDHLAPLSALLGIPLVVNEERIFELAKKFYPGAEVIYKDYFDIHPFVVQNFDLVFYCFLKGDFDENFGLQKLLFGKEVHTVWCPHGNSDKGRHLYFMEALDEEDHALVYGDKMLDFIKDKKIYRPKFYKVGDFRLQYYLKNKKALDLAVQKRLGPKRWFDLLYAPTWNDCEDNCSFLDIYHHIIENLPEGWRLIVKLHPNVHGFDQFALEELIESYKGREEILFLKDFPVIYPLLNYADLYIGDMSSIGYDFLYFDKPMYFLNKNSRDPDTDPGLFLYSCGVEIKVQDYPGICGIIEKSLPFDKKFSSERKRIFGYAFERGVDLSGLKRDLKGNLNLQS